VKRGETALRDRVDVIDFGPGAFAAGRLAEYDAEDGAIRVNARAVAIVRAALGEKEAQRFIACAVVHERTHRADPAAGEEAAHAAARAQCGVDPRRYEAVLRERRA
jgi:hypothetical protein